MFTLEEYEQWRQVDGRRIRVIEFPGIKSFARADLLAVMATEKPTWLRRYVPIGKRTRFYADDFAADIIRIEEFYAREGFPDATVRGYVYPGEKDMRLKMEISEGRPVILQSWEYVWASDSGAGLDSNTWSKMLPIKIGTRLARSDVQISADTLRWRFTTIGHARAQVSYQIEQDSANYTAHLRFLLAPGHFNSFGQTKITGLKQISDGTVRRELAYEELEPFDSREMEKTRVQIVRLETFNLVSIRADTSVAGDVLPVAISTEEGNRYRLRTSGGYHTEEGLRTEVEFSDLNFFGRGRRWTWKNTLAEKRRGTEFRLFWPHTPWNFTDVTIAPKWELLKQESFDVETRSATTVLSMRPSLQTTVALSNEVGAVIRYFDPGFVPPDTLQRRYTKSVETIAAGWDTRDNPLVTRQGHFISGTIAESGAFYRTDFRWWRATLQGRAWIPRGRRWTLAGKADVGIMGPLYDSDVTPIDERFFLGGPGSVRGWGIDRLSPRTVEGNPEGGHFSVSATAEVRRNVWGPASVAAFVDAGNVWSEVEHVDVLDVYPSAGLGMMAVTPVGPIRVDFAYQLRPNPFAAYDEFKGLVRERWAIHFSLGSSF